MNLLSALLFWSDRLTAGVLIIPPLFTLATKMASMSSLSGAKLLQLRWLLTPGMLSRLDMCLGTPTQVINLIGSMIIHQNTLNNNLLYLLDWSSVSGYVPGNVYSAWPGTGYSSQNVSDRTPPPMESHKIVSRYNNTCCTDRLIRPFLVHQNSSPWYHGFWCPGDRAAAVLVLHSQNITRLNQPRLTSSSRGRSPQIFYHPSCESKRVAGLISRICPIVLESFDLHLRHSGGTSFSTPWKMKSDVRKSRGFLFFITFYVESKLEWSFYGQ